MPTQEEQKSQQKNLWGGAALDWEKWDDWFQAQTRDLTEWLCTHAGIGPGMRVLDLASGAGQPAYTEAGLVGATGSVVCSDLAPEMLAAAKRVGDGKGITNIEYREVDIENIPFPDASFDAVTCRFGLMFCPDPEKGAREIARVLKPGARFALSVWDVPAKNVQFSAFFGPLGQIAPPPAADPKAPGLFRLAAPGELERVLGGAGFSEFAVESITWDWVYSSPENYWEIMTELAAPLKSAAASLPAGTLASLREAVIAGLQSRVQDGQLRTPTAPLCASGRK